MVKYDEGFFVKHSHEIKINYQLPIKLQKRELLVVLGFPVDESHIVTAIEWRENKNNIQRFLMSDIGQRVLIRIHFKPMPTLTVPFFLREKGVIKYRDEFGHIKLCTCEESIGKIMDLPPQTWLECTELTWGADPKNTVGRTIYFSFEKQCLEVQKGILPENLGKADKTPYLTIEFAYFDIRNALRNRSLICRLGFNGRELINLVDDLAKYLNAFNILREISKMPTPEFGFIEGKRLSVIDVDWPNQYLV